MSIRFYVVDHDYYDIVCQLVQKLYLINKKCLILCNSDDEVTALDNKLWAFSRLSFIPHSSKDTNIAKYCHTWISTQYVFYNSPTCLINLTTNFENINKFEELIFVLTQDKFSEFKFIEFKSLIKSDYTLWQQHNGTWQKTVIHN